ncbi:MAG TPA: hypothetical protein VFJ85_07845 [Acidimicrobiales bacterium]|nr:hypothetical protein [Acidimicrobiales bacterium]
MSDAVLQPTTRRGGWWRPTVAAVLVALSVISFVLAVPSVWARRNFLNTDRFVSRTAPLIHDPAVQAAVSARITAELMTLINPQDLFEQVLPEKGKILAVPLAGAVRGFVSDRVDTFVASDRFATIWESAIRVAHQTSTNVLRDRSKVVTAQGDTVTLNLIPVVDAVLAELTSATPELFGHQINIPDVRVEDVPKAAITKLEAATGIDLPPNFGQITVYDHGKVRAAQTGIRIFDRAVVLLVVSAIVFAAIAFVVSRRRRRTLLQLTVGTALGMVVIRRLAFTLDDQVAKLPPTQVGRNAAGVVVDAFTAPLFTFAAWVIAIAAVIALVAVLSGPYRWAVALRHKVAEVGRSIVSATSERAKDEATIAWIQDHRNLLLAGGVLAGLLVLWTVNLSGLGLLAVAALVGAFEAAVYRVGGPQHPEQPLPG